MVTLLLPYLGYRVQVPRPHLVPLQGAMNSILATQFDRISNVPVFDGGALILAELRAIREDMNQQLDEIKQRLHAA